MLLVSSVASATNLEHLTVQREGGGAVRDCYLWQENPDTNGNSDTLYVGMFGTSEKLALLHFDVSSIPADATVVDARLVIHLSGTPGVEIAVHPVGAPWTETEPTWNNFAANVSPTVKARFTAVDGRNVVDVTIAVQGWVTSGQNLGMALRQVTPAPSATFYSSDSADQLRRPSLEVIYSRARPIVESPVPALFASCGVPFRYQLSAHTPQASSYTITGEGPALDGATGEVTWTPSQTQTGAHSFVVRASLGNRTEELPLDVTVSCSRAMDVGFGCSASSAAPLVIALALLLRRRRA